MSAGGQRQEVRYLAMAIGSLVVAVVLFVGYRSFSQKSPPTQANEKRTEKKATKDKKSKAKEKAPALSPSNRDPFVSVGAGEVPVTSRSAPERTAVRPRDARPTRFDSGRGPEVAPEEDLNMRLAGILRGTGVTALIHVGDQRYYAQIGDTVGGFKLVKIGTNSVVLTNGSRVVNLTIQPEPGSSGVRSRVRTNRRR